MIRSREYNIGSWLEFAHVTVLDDVGRILFKYGDDHISVLFPAWFKTECQGLSFWEWLTGGSAKAASVFEHNGIVSDGVIEIPSDTPRPGKFNECFIRIEIEDVCGMHEFRVVYGFLRLE